MLISARLLIPPTNGLLSAPVSGRAISPPKMKPRAALQYKTTHPSRWDKVRETGHAIMAMTTPLLLARMGRGRIAAKTRTVGFAFQMMFGTLINAVLNRPGPVALDDPEMIDRLALAMCLQLEHEARGSGRAK